MGMERGRKGIGFTMKDKQAKRVVIINDVYSDTIEQAIFILRNAGTCEAEGLPGSQIVQEAQRIIDAYGKAMEKTQAGLERREQKSRRKGRGGTAWRFLWVGLAIAAFGAAGLLLQTFGGMLLALY